MVEKKALSTVTLDELNHHVRSWPSLLSALLSRQPWASPVEYVELILKREFLKYLPAIFHIQETLQHVDARLEIDLITPLDIEKNLGYKWKQHLWKISSIYLHFLLTVGRFLLTNGVICNESKSRTIENFRHWSRPALKDVKPLLLLLCFWIEGPKTYDPTIIEFGLWHLELEKILTGAGEQLVVDIHEENSRSTIAIQVTFVRLSL